MRWTWDEAKNRINLSTRGLSFEAAALVFDDPMAETIEDPYPYEQRWRTMGMAGNQVLMVVHTWPDFTNGSGEVVGRIIFARKATRHERMAYEEGI